MADAEPIREQVFESLGAVRDALSVRRVFGDPYELDGATVIPVAAVRGGGGGGGGEGNQPGAEGPATGAGMGYGLSARPLGVYVVRGGDVEWLPAVDVTRLALAGLLVGGLAVLTIRRALARR